MLKRMLQRVSDESGIDFQSTEPRFEMRDNGTSAEGRSITEAAGCPSVRIKLDVTTTDAERVVCPTVLRPVSHDYPDDSRRGAGALLQPGRDFRREDQGNGRSAPARDLYDCVNLFRRREWIIRPDRVPELYMEKCRARICRCSLCRSGETGFTVGNGG